MGCETCGQAWPNPRPLAYIHEATEEFLEVDPYTTETVVAYRTGRKDPVSGLFKPDIPRAVFETFDFHKNEQEIDGRVKLTAKHLLSTGVRFSKTTGSLCKNAYEDNTPELNPGLTMKWDEEGYLRIVTLNSWYASLCNCLFMVAFQMMDIGSTIMLCSALIFDQSVLGRSGDDAPIHFRYVGWIFIGCYNLSWMINFLIARHAALTKWTIKSSAARGDLITNGTPASNALTYLWMIVFEFFGVEEEVQEAVIQLHPFKAVQPYAAFKCEGHRAYFVGYPSRVMYDVENNSSFRTFRSRLLMRWVVAAFKSFMMIVQFRAGRFDKAMGTVTSLACSAPSIAMDCKQWHYMSNARSTLYRRLLNRLKTDAYFDRDADGGSRARNADVNLLAKHFNKRYDKDVGNAIPCNMSEMAEDSAKAAGSQGGGTRCRNCGRPLPHSSLDKTPESPLESPAAAQLASTLCTTSISSKSTHGTSTPTQRSLLPPPTSTLKLCHKCDEPLPERARFCLMCGAANLLGPSRAASGDVAARPGGPTLQGEAVNTVDAATLRAAAGESGGDVVCLPGAFEPHMTQQSTIREWC